MRVLIQDYSNFISTEPMYLNACFNRTGTVESFLWDEYAVSTYDVMDRTRPDVIICSYVCKSLNDIIKYLKSSKSKAELIVNITGMHDNDISILESMLETINHPFFIDGGITSRTQKKTKIINLLPAADMFLSPTNEVPTFSVGASIITTSDRFLVEKESQKYETYHKILLGNNPDQTGFFDLVINIRSMISFYNKYDMTIIADEPRFVFSQLFFDSTLRSNRTVLVSKDMDTISSVLGKLFNDFPENVDTDTAIKSQIKSKHTCYNRASRLLRALNNEEGAMSLQRISESL